tara:strand:+ start:43259 stop:44311 length:1053 start_codon:yes stop_codon:yes gene_type:complete
MISSSSPKPEQDTEPESRIEPVFVALALALGLTLVWAFYAPKADLSIEHRHLLTSGWEDCSDVVLIGTSRVQWVIDPQIYEEELPGYRVSNLGVPGVGLVQSYLDRADAVLGTDGAPKAIVVAIDSFNTNTISTTELNLFEAREGTYAQLAKAGTPPEVSLTTEDRAELALRRRGLCTFLWGLCSEYEGMSSSYGYNGHTPVNRQPADPSFMTRWYEWWFQMEGAGYSDAFLDDFNAQVAKWTANGVTVFGYISPDSPELLAFTSRYGFTPQVIRNRFVDSGGIFIETPKTLPTYDGQHIIEAEARPFTRRIANELAKTLPAMQQRNAPRRCEWPNVTSLTAAGGPNAAQ